MTVRERERERERKKERERERNQGFLFQPPLKLHMWAVPVFKTRKKQN